MVAARESSFDFVIVGSGGGALVAALSAREAGLDPVIIEKQDVVGGTTGMSGGQIWFPNNPLMRAAGVADSFEEGLAYFDSAVGPADRGSSTERRRAYLTHGPEVVSLMQRNGIRLVRDEGYADYYDNRPGGNARGRSLESRPWDARQLGDWQNKIITSGHAFNMAMMANDLRKVPVYSRSPRALAATARVLARTYLARARGQKLLTMGRALVGQLTKAVLDAGIPIWLDTRAEELVVEAGRVVGVRVDRDGASTVVRGRRGVLLAAGGFERNAEMRSKYTAESQPNDGRWTRSNPGNTGEMLVAAIALGARTDYMDEAIWAPGPRAELGLSCVTVGRQYPHAILVDKQGERFCNESTSYMEIGKAMYAHDAVPAWLIFDDEFRRRFPWVQQLPRLRHVLTALPGRMPEAYVRNGWIRRAATLEELGGQIGVSPEGLAKTVEEFNRHAVHGRDPHWGRGEAQFDKVQGDPANKPNPALGPLDSAPFYAAEIWPADVGTTGGVLTTAHAEVLDQSDAVIPGLYATGNMAATVVGRTYPGAGASIGNAMVFGHLAARHAAASA